MSPPLGDITQMIVITIILAQGLLVWDYSPNDATKGDKRGFSQVDDLFFFFFLSLHLLLQRTCLFLGARSRATVLATNGCNHPAFFEKFDRTQGNCVKAATTQMIVSATFTERHLLSQAATHQNYVSLRHDAWRERCYSYNPRQMANGIWHRKPSEIHWSRRRSKHEHPPTGQGAKQE